MTTASIFAHARNTHGKDEQFEVVYVEKSDLKF